MTESTKQCWSCEATTPYEIGWCEDCIAFMPLQIAQLADSVSITSDLPPSLSGACRMAIADWLRQKRRPAQQSRPKATPADGEALLKLLNL